MMQNHRRSFDSHHHILLSSLTREVILQKRTFPNHDSDIQIYQNEVHINNSFTFAAEHITIDEAFKRVFNELTKKVKIYQVRSFDKLSLSFTSCDDLTNESVQYLKKMIIGHFSGLKSLALNFYGASNFSLDAIELLSEIVSSFKDLVFLRIHLVHYKQISDEAMKVLLRRINRSQKHLKSLSVDVSEGLESFRGAKRAFRDDILQRLRHINCVNSYYVERNLLTEKGILAMNSAITRYFGTLQELNLNFRLSQLKNIDKVCQQLGRGILERMECLKRLTLNFCGCLQLTNEAMTLFSKINKRRLVALESLTIELALVKIGDVGLKLLKEGICAQFKDLKRLAINLRANKFITDEGLEDFNEKIASILKDLKSFTLAGYAMHKVEGKGVKAISQGVCKNLKSLKELALMFTKMDDSVLPAVSSDIEENSVKLEKLSLMFSLLSSSQPLDLSKFQQVLNTTLRDLIELNLNLSRIGNWVSHEVQMALGESLQPLAKLKRLALGLDQGDDRSDMFGQRRENQEFRLGALVPKTATLERLEAFFVRFFGMTDEHLNEFGASLCEFQRELRVVDLRFYQCMLLTNDGYKKFCCGIKHDLRKLEDLTLDFDVCGTISREVKAEMNELFREVPLRALD